MRAPLRFPGMRAPLVIGVAPDVVTAARGAAWSRKRAVGAPATAPAWLGAAEALRVLLAEGSAGARAAEVVVSDRWVRYCLIPRGAGIHRFDEQCAYARHLFRGEYGAAVDQWRICVDTDAAGSALAALIDDGLYRALEAACGAAGLRLNSLQPHFGATQALIGRRVPAGPTWCAVLERGHLAAALHRGGTWRHFAALRTGDERAFPDGPAIVAALAAQTLGLPEARTVRRLDLAGPVRALARLALPGGWDLRTWGDHFAAEE